MNYRKHRHTFCWENKSDNQNQTAIYHYRKALEIAKDKGCKLQEQEVYFGFGESYKSENNYLTATQSWKSLAETANKELSKFAGTVRLKQN